MAIKNSTGAFTRKQHDAQNHRYKENRGYDYVFVGTGNAALTCAALLARAGHRVCMLEAHDIPGGYAQTFRYGDYSFCAQVHYVWGCGPGGAIQQLLSKLDLAHEVTYELYDADGYDHVATPDGQVTKIPYGFDAAVESISANYPDQRSNLGRFFRIIADIYDQVGILPDPPKWRDYLVAPFRYPTVVRYHAKTLQQVFDECRLSYQAQAVLCANAGDFLLPPERLSVLLYAALMGGYGTGAYYPTKHFKHHIGSVADLIRGSDGCDIYYEAEVTDFTVERGRLVSVATADGKVFRAERGFICNMDPQKAAGMIGMDHFPRRYRDLLAYQYSDSALIVYLGLEGIDLRAYGFGRHNTWRLAQWDMNETWHQQNELDNHDKPWLFISTPSLFAGSQGHAPPNGQIMELGTSLSYRTYKELKERDPAAYKRRKRAVAERLLDIVEEHHVPGLRQHIKLRLVGTPTTNADFVRAPMGNAYGASLIPAKVKNRLGCTTPIQYLYWCNATAGYPSFCGTTTTGMDLYMELTGDRFVDRQSIPSRRDRERWATEQAVRLRADHVSRESIRCTR